MVLDAQGSLGIGTTSPAYTLDVNRTIVSDTGKIQSVFTSGMMIMNKALSGLSNCALYQGGTGDTTINSATGYPVKFAINNTEYMRIHTDGKVGIGITNPPTTLSILAPFPSSGLLPAATLSFLTTNGTIWNCGQIQGLQV